MSPDDPITELSEQYRIEGAHEWQRLDALRRASLAESKLADIQKAFAWMVIGWAITAGMLIGVCIYAGVAR